MASTRVFANVTVPDTPLITAALAFAKAHSTPHAYNHVQRCWLFSEIICSKLPELATADREVVAVASILHDLGWDPTGALITPDKRFEVDGADAARTFLQRTAAPPWSARRVQLVWDAIALHTTESIALFKEPEVAAMVRGVLADVFGPDGVPGGLLTWDEYGAVVRELPLLGLIDGLKAELCALCVRKPQTTWGNFVGEYGQRFVDGYDRTGKQAADALLASEVDSLTEKEIERRARGAL